MVSNLNKQFTAKQKGKLENLHVKILKQIETLKKEDPFKDPDRVIDNAAVDTEVREQDSHQIIEAQINNLNKRLNDIEIALKKMSKNRYGYCEKCGKPILIKRLELLPEARYCVDCDSKLRK